MTRNAGKGPKEPKTERFGTGHAATRHLPPPLAVDDAGRMYRARASRDLADFEAHLSGNYLASLLLVKGTPGPAERAGGRLLSGPDGEAISKALPRMGFDDADTCMCLVTLADGETLDAAQLEAVVYSIDPIVVVTLDREALLSLGEALRIPDVQPGGEYVAPVGCKVVSVDGFEALLATQSGKRMAWNQLRRAKRPGEPF